MANPFLKDFDDLFAAILTDWQNQFPEADVSQGSLIYIKSACLASALWGVFKYHDWIGKQIFCDTADTANLEHHAWVYGLTRQTGESDAELLERLLSRIRHAPAGGNKYDYEAWAGEVEGVKAAYCMPLAQGLGTVDMVILADGAEEIPDQELLDEVFAYIDAKRPVALGSLRVLAPTGILQDVTMTITGDADIDVIKGDIENYMNNLIPGEDLAIAQIFAIAIINGATNAVITEPSADVEADPLEIIRPGTITVS